MCRSGFWVRVSAALESLQNLGFLTLSRRTSRLEIWSVQLPYIASASSLPDSSPLPTSCWDSTFTPPKPTTLECEPLLRVFLGTLGTDADLRAALAQVRADGNAVLDVGRVVGSGSPRGTVSR